MQGGEPGALAYWTCSPARQQTTIVTETAPSCPLRHLRKTLSADTMGHLIRDRPLRTLPSHALLTPGTFNRIIPLPSIEPLRAALALLCLRSARLAHALLSLPRHGGAPSAACYSLIQERTLNMRGPGQESAPREMGTMPKAQRTTVLARNWIASAMPPATAWHALIKTSFDAGVQKPPGYCWSTPECRKLCLAYAVFEGPRTWKIRSTKCSHVAWKEVDQQYPPVK